MDVAQLQELADGGRGPVGHDALTRPTARVVPSNVSVGAAMWGSWPDLVRFADVIVSPLDRLGQPE